MTAPSEWANKFVSLAMGLHVAERTLQMVEAFNDALTKHRKQPVVEPRQPVKR